jgi:hypothetical protein
VCFLMLRFTIILYIGKIIHITLQRTASIKSLYTGYFIPQSKVFTTSFSHKSYH